MTCEEFWNGEPHALDHLGVCPGCAARFERQQRLAVELHRLGTELRGLAAPAGVERRIVAGFRARAELLPVGRQAGMWWTIGSWAAALVVTVGIAIFLAGGRQPERTERQPRRATQFATVEAPVTPPAEEDGFIPLPNVEGFAANEPVNLVRMEIPRATLIALGVEMSADEPEEPVEADVMLGADGMARAVRVLD
jgi:hypothetical protein